MRKFEITDDQFTLDGEPIQLISGAIHYFRVVPEYWEDRLLKLKACGFNTVETYIPWNLHEPEEGQFQFTGLADVEKFIEIAQRLDLLVIVRPSPYICAEWEFGGLPYWLLSDSEMKVRCYHKPYLEKIKNYYEELLPRLKPHLCTNGGPIIAMQIENEYGSYGNDTAYLEYINELFIQNDIDVLLFTSDGPDDSMLQGGMVPGIFETVNFGSGPVDAFNQLKKYQPNKPLMCMEFWNGWFDHWFEEHHTRDPQDVAATFEEMLQMGASVNFYMFHGGTNFGFYNGANHINQYEPTVTSYDYDAPLNESGEPTEKYYLIRDIITKHTGTQPLDIPELVAKKDFGTIELSNSISIFQALETLGKPIQSVYPLSMEELGQDYGYILYETQVSGPRTQELFIKDVHDRALIFIDYNYIGTYERWDKGKKPLTIEVPKEGAKLSILVENMGRINYGPHLTDKKGITDGALLGNQFLFGWSIYPLKLDQLDQLRYQNYFDSEQATPTFLKGKVEIDIPADTYVHVEGGKKGNVWVNGFHLGRYWEVGPQERLYLPGPLLKKGLNEIVVFELHAEKQVSVRFVK